MSDAMDDLMQRMDRESAHRTDVIRTMLIEAGRPELADELHAKLRDIRLGLDGARSTWAALSAAQRRVLEALETGRRLVRQPHRPRYHAIGAPDAIGDICGVPTARNLIARDLLDCEGGAFDPEARLTLSDRGRFVLTHGRPTASPGS